MEFVDNYKFSDPERHALLALITESYVEGCVCEVRLARKGGKTYEIYLKLGLVEDLIPFPATIEEYTRYIHLFERFASKWNRRGVQITLDTWGFKDRNSRRHGL